MKILVDLNMKEKITMIMVTHDVGLKTFAHRVVRMADGKVHKIQTTPVESRNKIISDLNSRVKAIHEGTSENLLMIREGINIAEKDQNHTIPENYKAVLDPSICQRTSVRRPEDYPVLGERFKNKT